jgi:hypothetical protein
VAAIAQSLAEAAGAPKAEAADAKAGDALSLRDVYGALHPAAAATCGIDPRLATQLTLWYMRIVAEKGKLKGKSQPDTSLRDSENVPLSEDVETYFKREVLPHASDAWIDHEKTKVGYEIPFNRHFYVFKAPRSLSEIDADLKITTDRILTMIGGLTK